MTDEQFVFFRDVADKKKTANSVFKRKGGTRKCTLPSDHLTKKEREAMNGEVKILQLDKAISWEEFTGLKKEWQEAYLDHLLEKYGVSLSLIGATLWGKRSTSLNHYVSKNGLVLKHGSSRGRRSAAVYKAWGEWLAQNEKAVQEPVDAPVEKPVEKPAVSSMTVSFDNVSDMAEVHKLLDSFPVNLIDGARVTISIERR